MFVGVGEPMWRVTLGVIVASLGLATAAAQQPSQTAAGWITDKHQCRVWDPEPRSNESVSWDGACPGGVAQGKGVLQWYRNDKPTDRFEGNYTDGRPDGQGVYLWINGNRYEGSFKAGLPDGH